MSAASANDPLWYHTATARPPIPRPRGAATADVAIVGGGLTGLSAALHLAETGASVVVLETDEIGAGASGRNGGFVVPHFARGEPDDVISRLGDTGERLVHLVGNSAQALFSLVARLRIDCDAAKGGWYQAAHSAAAWRLLQRRAEQWSRHGQMVTVHDASETSRLTGTRGYFGSWGNASGGTVHPLKLVHGLAAAVLARGAEIREHSCVERMAPASAGRWLLTTGHGDITAGQVLLCTNALSWRLVPRLSSAVTPATIYQVATEPIAPDVRAHLLGAGQAFSDTRINLFTYRFDAQWRLITGALPGLSGDRHLRAQLSTRLQTMLSLPFAPTIDYLWSGRGAVGPKFLPALYAVDKGVVASAGCNGRGVALALEIGRLMAGAAGSGHWAGLPIPFRDLKSMKASLWKRWGVRWYPMYGAVRDRLEQFSAS